MTDDTIPARPATPPTIRFGHLEIAYDDRVLRPRQWTMAQSLWAAELMRTAPEGAVLELCSGAGHIGLLALVGSGRRLVCVDAEPVACAYAERNARAAGLGEVVEVRHAELDRALSADERFAVVIADPPWVRGADTDDHPDDPDLAIDGGDDGLDLARQCLRVAGEHLVPGGSVVLQIGTPDQASRLREELSTYAGRLDLVEVRALEGGVLARLDAR